MDPFLELLVEVVAVVEVEEVAVLQALQGDQEVVGEVEEVVLLDLQEVQEEVVVGEGEDHLIQGGHQGEKLVVLKANRVTCHFPHFPTRSCHRAGAYLREEAGAQAVICALALSLSVRGESVVWWERILEEREQETCPPLLWNGSFLKQKQLLHQDEGEGLCN